MNIQDVLGFHLLCSDLCTKIPYLYLFQYPDTEGSSTVTMLIHVSKHTFLIVVICTSKHCPNVAEQAVSSKSRRYLSIWRSYTDCFFKCGTVLQAWIACQNSHSVPSQSRHIQCELPDALVDWDGFRNSIVPHSFRRGWKFCVAVGSEAVDQGI
jgi:hypothetical protein